MQRRIVNRASAMPIAAERALQAGVPVSSRPKPQNVA